MNDWQKQVQDFQKAIGHPHEISEPMMRSPRLRARLIIEEAIETIHALVGPAVANDMVKEIALSVTMKGLGQDGRPSIVEAIDGLCDTIVVCCGTALDIGVDLAPFYDEVMRSNMAKVGGPVDEHGKRQKPPGWAPPDLTGVLARVTSQGTK